MEQKFKKQGIIQDLKSSILFLSLPRDFLKSNMIRLINNNCSLFNQ